MVDQTGLSVLAVALILVGVAVLAMLATYFTEGRGSTRLLFWLVAIWLLACIVAFAINPMTWPNQTM